MAMSCTSCGLPTSADARFCPNCGAPQIASDEERRLVTVLFADIVGFTALSEHRDPEQVKHFVDRTFERLARDITSFGGVIDKVLGDAIIALFGAPVAHEDDAERAVRAGLKMHETIADLAAEISPPIKLRIGINTGEVLVGTTSAGGDYTAMGDVMNSAARLEEMAEPGWTLVGATTKEATGDAINYRAAGLLETRGRGEPLEAWVAHSVRRLPGEQKMSGTVFVGRRHELALLEAQARLAFSGQRAQLSVILGEAGIGKSRLAHQVGSEMEREVGALILEGRCLPYGEANVWWIVAEILRDLFSLPVDLPQPEAERGVRRAIIQHFTPEGTSALRGPAADQDIERYSVAVLHALGYKTRLRGGDRNRNRSEVMLAFAEVLGVELSRRPVALMMSDMHWANNAIWLLLDHVLAEHARRRLVVLVTMRPNHNEYAPRARAGLSVIHLGPLDHAASLELLHRSGVDLPADRTSQLVERSGGNPYFLEELADLVLKRDERIAGASHQFDVDHLNALPATLRGIISAHLDQLDGPVRAVLEDAAVLGRTGSIEGLSQLVSESRGFHEVAEALAVLREQDLLELEGKRFRFRTDLVRDVAYGRLTKTTRAQRHFRIASFIEESQPEEEVRNSVVVAMAEHYRAAASLLSELSSVAGLDPEEVRTKALYWLREAGERAMAAHLPPDAMRWFGYGVDLARDDDTLAEFLFGRAQARSETQDLGGARADLDRLELIEVADPALLARSLLVRGDVDRKAGDLEQATDRLTAAAHQLEGLGLADQQSLALRLLGLNEMFRCREAEATAALQQARDVAMEAGDRRSTAWALQTLAWHAFRTGQVHQAESLAAEAMAVFTELDDRGGMLWTQGVQAWVDFHRGRWEQARTLVDKLMAETKRRGDPLAHAIVLSLEASLDLWSGHAQQAVEVTRRASALLQQLDDPTMAVNVRAIEGRALVSLGRIDEGTGVLDLAYMLADEASDEHSRRLAVIVNTNSAARLGEPERALRWASRFDRDAQDLHAVGGSALITSVALAYGQRGEITRAMEEIGRVMEVAETTADGSYYGSAVAAILTAAAGHSGEVEALVTRTLDGPSTYHDKVSAYLARAASRYQQHDQAGCAQALDDASAIVAATDDQPTRLLIDLVSAFAGRSSVVDAENRMRRGGMDPEGWSRIWAQAFHRQEPMP